MTQRPGDHEDPLQQFLVLANSLGRHSLWPATLDTPAGWPVVHGPALRKQCLDFINRSTTHRGAAARPSRPRGNSVATRPRKDLSL